jgi:uncharacterized protein YndB with AHSA1/START domain
VFGTYADDPDRPTLTFERRFPHPVEAVWEAITTPDDLSRWFPSAVDLELRVGGRMTFTFEHELADGVQTMEGEVVELDPPHLFAFYWGDDRLVFELEPRDGGAACQLRFTVVLESRDKAARDAAGWHECLDQLADRLDGAEAGAPRWRERYEEYKRRGLPADAPIPVMPE